MAESPLSPPAAGLSRLRAALLLGLVAFIWGSAFVAQKTAFPEAEGVTPTSGIGPLTFNGIRFLLGALIVLPFALRADRRMDPGQDPTGGGPRALPGWLWAAFVGIGGVLFVASWTQQVGIIGTSVTNAGFLTAVYVPLVPVLARLAFRQPVRRIVWLGALGSLAGAWFLTGAAEQGLTGLSTGDLWVLTSALFWALHVVLVGWAMGRCDRSLTLAAVQFIACGLLGCLAGLALEDPTWADIWAVAPEIAYAGGLSVGVAYTLQVVAQRHTPAPAAAIILSTEMVFAALAGAVALGERLSGGQWLGAGLILASILMVELTAALGERRRAPRAAAPPAPADLPADPAGDQGSSSR